MVMSLENIQLIHPDLENNAKRIQESEIGTLVLGANYFYIDSFLIEMDLLVQEPKKLNILEEFILKALSQFNPPPSLSDLSSVLGLDSLFIEDAIKNLLLARIIQKDTINNLKFTDTGLQSFKDGCYPVEKTVTDVRFVYIEGLSSLMWIRKEKEDHSIDYDDADNFRKDPAFEKITLKQTINSLVEFGSDLHSPSLGRRVTAISDIRQLRVEELACPAYLLLDKLKFSKMEDDNLSVRLFNPLDNQRDFVLEKRFPICLRIKKLVLKKFFQPL